jgi:hypothetical protein
MLRITNVTEVLEEKIDINDYRVDIVWGNFPSGSQYYWVAGNTNRSLLEIGVVGYVGRIHSIGLVAADNFHILPPNSMNYRLSDVPKAFGQPICDISGWGGYFQRIEVQLPIYVTLGLDFLRMTFQATFTASRCIYTHRVNYILDEIDHLCGIEITDLTDTEIDSIRWKFKEFLGG